LNIVISTATGEDLSALAVLFNDYRVFYKQPSDINLAQAFLSERIHKQESVILYAKSEQGQYLGFTQLYPTFSSVSAKRVWILNDLFVSEMARNMGVGKKLLDKAKEFAGQTRAKGLSLQTATDNFGAQKLYEGLGYKQVNDYLAYFLTL
jgi:ribosomal protein S18 acetylase RimI-like enzyme